MLKVRREQLSLLSAIDIIISYPNDSLLSELLNLPNLGAT